MSNSEKEILESYSARLSKLNKENLSRLYSEGDFKTQNQMFEALIENYFSPRLTDKNKDIQIKKLEEQLNEKEEEFKKLIIKNEDLEKEIQRQEEILSSYIVKYEELERLQAEEKSLMKQYHVYPIRLGEFNYNLLKFVAEREGKKRKQEWTIEDVINYFIHTRFELGQLNGDLESVPDHIVKQLKQK